MPGRYDAPEPEDWDDDPDAPQARDLVGQDDDDDETPTFPCPSCRAPIPEFADRCPYCGDWVVQGGRLPGRAKWIILAAILALLGFLLVYVL
jgi:hypothetical protein